MTTCSYVILTATATALVNGWIAITVGKLRRKAKVAYPTPYASPEQTKTDPDAYALNCAHRAQANTIENMPSFIPALLIAGLGFPKAATTLGATYLVSRVLFTVGYINSKIGDGGRGRRIGGWGVIPLLGLVSLAGYVGYQMIIS